MTLPLAVRPIDPDDVVAAARFLHDTLNDDVSTAAWERLLQPPWAPAGDRGFALYRDDRIVGVYAAVRSERDVGGQTISVCNLAAFCVQEEFRTHGLRLVRALLAAEEVVFTDLSPSGNVVALNERLGFRHLATEAFLAFNLPSPRTRGVVLSANPHTIADILDASDARIHDDHRRAQAARHLVIQQGDTYAYLVYRRDRRKRLPVFATPLYAGGDRDLLRRAWPAVRTRLLRQGLVATLAEPRLLGFTPGSARRLRHPRAKMVRGAGWPDDAVDYLYSELALVSW
ncbi:hypothetical protein [Microbacterium aurum]|uniref:hypothetical protein n=1 Tax=Microbacterium aurum TaxID=36805 RepID=UPI0028E9F758|nr:hypothetical protein [Microbacterium aurum]